MTLVKSISFIVGCFIFFGSYLRSVSVERQSNLPYVQSIVNSENNAQEGTNGLVFQTAVNRAIELSIGLEFKECAKEDFEEVCRRAGIELHEDISHEFCPDIAMGCASDSKIFICVDWCYSCINNVFFHELGHILLRHYGSGKDYETEKEVEADYFGSEVMEQLGLPLNHCDRRSWHKWEVMKARPKKTVYITIEQ